MHWLGHFLTHASLCAKLRVLGAGRWKAGAGHWSVGAGHWALELGARRGIWVLDVGHWESGAGHRALGTGRRVSSAPEKSKVVTGASFYELAWTFPKPVQSCATIRGLCRALQQKVKW